MILDVGVSTLEDIIEAIDQSKTVVWNGALGVSECPPFDYGTKLVARHLAKKTKAGSITSVAGGGDTVGALNQAGCLKDFTYVSMAGGAFLEWLQGYPLPGVEALRESGEG
jgi:phosphoglycerate kinase